MPKPPLPLDKVRNTQMIVRFTIEEMSLIRKFAKKEKITVTQLVKRGIVLYSQTCKKQVSFDFPDFI